MHAFRITFATLLLATTAAAQAAPSASTTPLADCIDLAPDHQAFAVGTQTLLIHNGDAHYRVSFYGDCSAIAMPRVEISTSGTSNRLCPKSTRVSARTYTCTVRSVDEIDADRYASYRRKAR